MNKKYEAMEAPMLEKCMAVYRDMMQYALAEGVVDVTALDDQEDFWFGFDHTTAANASRQYAASMLVYIYAVLAMCKYPEEFCDDIIALMLMAFSCDEGRIAKLFMGTYVTYTASLRKANMGDYKWFKKLSMKDTREAKANWLMLNSFVAGSVIFDWHEEEKYRKMIYDALK